MDYDIRNDVDDLKRPSREKSDKNNKTGNAGKPSEVLTVSGEVVSAPETGESQSGKRWCAFDVQAADGRVYRMHTVRFREEAVRLGVGDRVSVRYIRNGQHNNLVGSIVLDGEGRAVDNLVNTVHRLEKKVDLVADMQTKVLSRVGDVQRKLDWLASEAEKFDDDCK